MRKQKILVVLGSTRPGRQGEKIANWFMDITKTHDEIEFDLVDVADLKLPLLDEPMPPAMGNYQNEHTKQWAEKVSQYDGFVFVTPEYNYGMPASLKNALDFVGQEWYTKPIAFVGYGGHLGVRSVQQFRESVINLEMVPINAQVEIMLFDQLDEDGNFVPTEKNKKQAENLITKIKWWSEVLSEARAKEAA